MGHASSAIIFTSTAKCQRTFSEDICKIFVSCGISWNALGLVYYIGKAEKKVVGKVKVKMATGQCDSWDNIAKTHVVTSMMTVEHEPYLVHTHNMLGEPKMGNRLFELVLGKIQYIKDKFSVEVIGWCTGNGPDGKKILSLEVIKWFNEHDAALMLLCTEQKFTFNGKFYALILPMTEKFSPRIKIILEPLTIATNRIFGQKADIDFLKAFTDYSKGQAEFSDERMSLAMMADMHASKDSPLDLVLIWTYIDTDCLTGHNRLVKLAIHILSVIANSAGCKRVFSDFGLIHTKPRNKLSVENVHKTSTLKMDLRIPKLRREQSNPSNMESTQRHLSLPIPLKLLFDYNVTSNMTTEASLDFYWKGGLKNLNQELTAYDLLCEEEDESLPDKDEMTDGMDHTN
ncbi:hypothetical protein PILCRDRAFT_92459 [Piloderma croceum F 1598]|uniref:HAT C-terminal dimerisation domain-containing protein n=1 Tax=Piloderma croceum (strain F 1598) TaxID=765440 RepID=A0A0C3EQD4_PILCF|nr:hypothetical protein PILCRDRAFT_92459 [Piloderma croceum F 1598]